MWKEGLRYVVRIRKKMPLSLSGHSQPRAKVCGLAKGVKAAFRFPLLL